MNDGNVFFHGSTARARQRLRLTSMGGTGSSKIIVGRTDEERTLDRF